MAKKQKKHWIKRIFSYVVIVLILIIGLGLVFNSQIESFWLGMQSNQKVSSISKNEVKNGEKRQGNYDFSNVKAVSGNAITESEKARKENAIGKITIPALKINLPIFKGLDSENLTIGAGTMKADQKMGQGNYVLAGHHMEDPNVLFSPLAKAKEGQLIKLSNASKTYKYKISKVKVVPETDVSVINDVPGKKELTLVTCASGKPGETRRIIVTADLEK